MDKQQAIKIVRNTFESSFERERFKSFVKDLLNEADFTQSFGSRSGQYIPESFKDYIEKYERLGVYEDSEEKRIDLLIVHLKKETSIERARSMQRNFIAGYLQGNYGSKSEKDAALVAFVAPNGEDWRFSLVRLEVRLEANDGGKLKVKDEFTPAKRWSFLVGSHEKSHTAQTQFVPIMQDTENNPTLVELEEAFSIEKVTNEFFKEYRRLFIWTKDELDKAVKKNPKTKADFESKGIDTVNLAKKLLGQIIFLYYLQKKGWFGMPTDAAWGAGSKNFLRELFEKKHGDYKNFFNDILKPLFYEALRIDRSHDDHYYRLFDCKIPFLNGGLFDPMGNYDWVHTEILLANDLFSNKKRINEVDTGDGILDVFDRYNFTVREDEPFEKEVAIDPELLGKAYEKFNAIRPDNYKEYIAALDSGKKGDESKFNKQYGVYYTPREIVHYMCQQSLINYLYAELNPESVIARDDSPEAISTTEKGIASSPQPLLAMTVSKDAIALLIQHGESLQEHEAQAAEKETRTYSPIIAESIRVNASLIDEKLAAIKVCDPAVGSGAFPVGMMSEIIKAREALKTWTKSKKTTYDFKRECIENSLYGVDIDSGAVEIAKLRLWLSLMVDEDDPQNIKPLPNLDYKIVRGDSLVGVEKNLFNLGLYTELESLKPLYFNATSPTKKQEYKKKIDSLIDQITDGRAQFDFEIYFSEVFHEKAGFDVVIANPPYIQLQKIHDISKQLSKLGYETYTKVGDIYCIFYEKSIRLLRDHGVATLITSNSWLRTQYGELLRKYFVTKGNPTLLLNFEDSQLFEDAIVETNILLIEKAPWQKRMIAATIKDDFLKGNSIEEYIQSRKVIISELDEGSWNISDQITQDLKGKIETNSILLRDLDVFINRGILTGFNEALIIDEKRKKELILKDKRNAKIIEPILRGRDVKKFTCEFDNVWLINSHNGVKNSGLLRINIPKDYPVIYEYLKDYQVQLKKRQDQGDHWTNLRNCAYLDEFKKEKIVWGELSNVPKFAYDPDGLYADVTLFIMTGSNLKYLLAILNSKVSEWYFNQISTSSGMGTNRWKKYKIEMLPVKTGSPEQQKSIIKLVERVLAAKRANPAADTSKLEGEIDQLVYQLYGLTEDEVRIVEGKG